MELVGFSTPRAITINLLAILGFLALWPTERLGDVPVRSVWESVFHVRPYSSGMMRALSSLLHLDLAGAAKFNRLSFVVLPLIIGLVVVNCTRWYRGRMLREQWEEGALDKEIAANLERWEFAGVER